MSGQLTMRGSTALCPTCGSALVRLTKRADDPRVVCVAAGCEAMRAGVIWRTSVEGPKKAPQPTHAKRCPPGFVDVEWGCGSCGGRGHVFVHPDILMRRLRDQIENEHAVQHAECPIDRDRWTITARL